jgi:hypothetical protein
MLPRPSPETMRQDFTVTTAAQRIGFDNGLQVDVPLDEIPTFNAVAATLAPAEGVTMRPPVSSGLLDDLLDCLPGLKAAPFQRQPAHYPKWHRPAGAWPAPSCRPVPKR